MKEYTMAIKHYDESPEIKDIATKLKERYYLYIGHVDLDVIYFAEITSENGKPKKAKLGQLEGVSSAWLKQKMIEDKKGVLYCLSVWAEEWDGLDPASREWFLFDLLYSVSGECDGKVRKPDISEHGIIMQYMHQAGVGTYWRTLEKPLPSLLSSVDPLPIPLPPTDEDAKTAGSTLGDD